MRRIASVGAVGLAMLIGACEGGSNPGLTVELIDPSGQNAALDVVEGTLRLQVEQDGRELCEDGAACSAQISGGDFDLTLPIADLEAITRIRGEITGADAPLEGAVPPFAVAGEFLETAMVPVRLVMMPVGDPSMTCQPITLSNFSTSNRPRLVVARRDMGVAIRRNLIVLAGGVGEGGDSDRVDFFDQVVFEMRPPLQSTPAPLGRARALAMSEDDTLVVGNGAYVYRRQIDPPGPPAPTAAPSALHDGVDYGSALVRLEQSTVVIGGSATAEVSWVTAQGNPSAASNPLPEVRPSAVAAANDQGILVVGGGVEGGVWLEANEPAVPIDGLPAGDGGWLAVSPSGDSFLWIGGTGADTWLITGCPGACTATESDLEWSRARSGASGVQTRAGAFWIVGGDDSAAIDRVIWDSDTQPRLVEGPSLVTPRAGAAVAEHASGVVIVIGGEGSEGMHDDAELCTPPEGVDPLI